uniref:Small ribosomal subunit protein mS38 n=2 Tax=Latimeria chalumnae TaxID=7897 RepID=H3BHY1_LATCH
MILSRLTSQLKRTSTLAGNLLFSSCSNVHHTRTLSSNYSTRSAGRNGVTPQRWYALDPELEEILVPRKMAVSPLESWLTIRYAVPKVEVIDLHKKIGYDPNMPTKQYNCPSAEGIIEIEEEGGEMKSNVIQCKNVLEIRRRKMNRHKYRKFLKRTKFLRRRVKDVRRKKRQARFEKDLKRIWRRAGLKAAPDGWHIPRIYIKQFQKKSQ